MESFSPIELWGKMGFLARGVVLLLVGMSVYSLWVMIDRYLVVRRARAASLRFVLALRQALEKNDLAGARAAAQAESQSPLAKVVAEALKEREIGTAEDMYRALDRMTDRELASLKRGLGGLASISSAAPFIGLFGTVIGIINAFRSMASSGQGGLGAVSGGIAEALFTTAVGLAVAIPAVLAFNYFTNAIEEFGVDIADVSSELVTFVARRDRKA